MEPKLINDHFQNEEWQDIPGFEGLYQASIWGRIRSVERKIKQYGHKNYYERIMRSVIIKPRLQNGGYLLVWLSKNGKARAFSVHRLVALTFIPNGHNANDVNHIDGNKQNNNVSNLEWVTRSQNIKHSHKYLQRKPTKRPVYCVERKEWYQSATDAATLLGLNRNGITNAANGHSKTSGGYTWLHTNQN